MSEERPSIEDSIPGFGDFISRLADHLQKSDPEGFAKQVAFFEANPTRPADPNTMPNESTPA